MLSSFFFFLNNIHKSNIPQSRLALGHEMENLCYKTHLLLLKAERCAEKLVQYDNILNTEETRFIWLVYNIKQKSNTNAILKQTTLIRCFEVKPIFSSSFS